MRADVTKDLNDSAQAFRALVWPALEQSVFRGAEMICGEMLGDSAFFGVIDRYAGVDAWLIRHEQGTVYTIASRVQFVAERAWPSFTIREERYTGSRTELEKRLVAVKEGAIYPSFTVQAYVLHNPPTLLKAFTVATLPLYEHILGHWGDLEQRVNPDDGNLFRVVWVKDLRAARVAVWEVPVS